MQGKEHTLAAIDLGSNSFHMLIAQVENEQLKIIDRNKEMVRLAGGLDSRMRLTAEAQARAIACLERFGQRIRDLPDGNVRIVGTNTLRKARNARDFLILAEKALNHNIEIVSGMEEARLIYLGVAHSLPRDEANRLVIDIGGGSTEVIVGNGFDALKRESLSMGCVSMTRQFFPDHKISNAAWNAAVTYAKLKLLPLIRSYSELGWGAAIGASGTMRSVAEVQKKMGWSDHGITGEGMDVLVETLLQTGHFDKLDLSGLSSERRDVFVGGASIVAALFEAFDLHEMQPAQGALREGVLYDLSGRIHHEDVRGRTIDHLLDYFHVNTTHAERVMRLLVRVIETGAETLALDECDVQLVLWAGELHEIGLSVAHSQYHKHGEYLVKYADMPGFTHREQRLLALLIRAQRRKISSSLFEDLSAHEEQRMYKLITLLRLALVLRRDRSDQPVPLKRVKWDEKGLKVRFKGEWLEEHPLTLTDLESEAKRLGDIGVQLRFS